MWHVAVYRPGQHEQYSAVGDRFCLTRSAADRCWNLSEGDARPLAATALRLRVEDGQLWLECRGVDGRVELPDGESRDPRTLAALPCPPLFRVGDAWFDIRLGAADASQFGLEPLDATSHSAMMRSTASSRQGPDAHTVARWFSAVSRLHRVAASSPEFFATAAQLTLESTGLDVAMVLTRRGNQWQIAGSAVEYPEHGIAFEPAALALIVEQPEVWRRPSANDRLTAADAEQSTARESIVVAPVRNDAGEAIAAVYGVRHGRGDNRRRGVRPLEARVVELMADAVAAGLARRRQEIESARQQVLLEQAFSPPVAEYLRRYPSAMARQTREVTMLFADLRGSTALAHDLAPNEMCDLLGELLELMTQSVIQHDGVVIDYYGDGLCALWNAPLDAPHHTDLACLAALDMLASLPDLSRRWRTLAKQPLALGVGLHAGEVQVGNAGTHRRVKYGPRGAAVNVAHRVQSATKALDVPLLATGAVRQRLSTRFVTLKTCTARLPGLEEPIDLFTVFPATDGVRLQAHFDRYAQALSAFENGDLDRAEQLLEQLLSDGQATPAAFLAQQTAALRGTALGRRATDLVVAAPDAVIEIFAK
jgi:adenylate cyclase